MAKPFNLVANLVLAGPTNLRPMVTRIQTSLNNIKANVDIKINSVTANNLKVLSTSFSNFNSVLKNTTINANNAATALVRLNSSITNSNFKTFNTTLNTTSSNINKVSKATMTGRNELAEFGRVAGLAIRRFTGFVVGTAILFGFINSMKEGIRSAIDFQHQLVRLSQLSGNSLNGMKGLSSTITDLSMNLGVSSTKLMSISDTLIQAGLSSNDTRIALEALAKTMLAPAFENIEKTTEGSIAIMAQFKIKANELEAVLSSMHAVAAQFAVESQDIITAIQIAGGSFSVLSQGVATGKEALDQFMAIFTSVRATTRESAESIATGMRTIFTRLERPQTISQLKQIGVELVDLEGKFVGPYEAITRISNAMRQMDPRDVRFMQLGEMISGYRQINKAIPMLLQAETRVKALAVAQQGEAALSEVVSTAQQSWTIQMTKTHERFLALMRDVSNTTTFQALITTINTLAHSFIRLGEVLTPILPALAAIMSYKAITNTLPLLFGVARGLKGKAAMATGGLVPGSGNGDTYPAMLTPGEFVINKDAARSIGYETLDKLNNKNIAHYANGTPFPTTTLRGYRRATRRYTTNPENFSTMALMASMGLNFAEPVRESPIGNAVTQGLTGAAIGGMIPKFGVPGAALGGTLGVVQGYRETKANQELKSAQTELTRNTKDLSKSFDDLVKGGSLDMFNQKMQQAAESAEVAFKATSQKENVGSIMNLVPNNNIEQRANVVAGGFAGRLWQRTKNFFSPLTGYDMVGEQAKEYQMAAGQIAQNRRESYGDIGNIAKAYIMKDIGKGITAEEAITAKTPESRQRLINIAMANTDVQHEIKWQSLKERGFGSKVEEQQIIFGQNLIKEEAKMTEKMRIASNTLEKFDSSLAILNQSMAIMTAKMAETENIGLIDRVQMGAAMGALHGSYNLGNMALTNKYSNYEAYSGQELAGTSRDLYKKLGIKETPQLTESLNIIEKGKNAQAIFNQILQGAGQNPAAAIDLSTVTKELPESMKAIFTAKMENLLGGDTPIKNIGELASDITVIKSINEFFKDSIEPLVKNQASIINANNENLRQYGTAISEVLQLQLRINEQTADRAQLLTEQQNALVQLKRPHEVTWQEAYRPIQTRIGTLAQQGGIGANNGMNLGAIQVAIAQNREQRQELSGKANKESVDELKRLNEKDAALQKLLELLHTDNTKIIGIQNDLANIQKTREAAQATAADIYLMDPFQRVQLGRQLTAFSEFKQTGQLQGGVRGQEAVRGGMFLERSGLLKPEEIQSLQLLRTKGIYEQVGFTPQPNSRMGLGAMAIGTAEQEKKLLTKWQTANDIKIDASNSIIANGVTTAELNITTANINLGAVNQAIKEGAENPFVKTNVGKANGGIIRGFASGGKAASDTIPAWLTPGEFVINARATAENIDLLEDINSGYANGGRVARKNAYQDMMAARRAEYAARHAPKEKVLSDRQQSTLWDKITGISKEPKKFYFNGEQPKMKQVVEQPQANMGLPFPMPELFNKLPEVIKPVEVINPANFRWAAPNGRLQGNVNASMGILTGRPNNESAEERQARIHAAVVANRGYNRGGIVRGYANGGTVNGGGFDTSSFDRLSSSLDKFFKINIPESITLEGNFDHTVTVIGESSLASAIVSAIQSNIEQITQNQLKKIMNFDTGETKAISPGTPLGK